MYDGNNLIVLKSRTFAIRIIRLYQYLQQEKKEFVSINNDLKEINKLLTSIVKTSLNN